MPSYWRFVHVSTKALSENIAIAGQEAEETVARLLASYHMGQMVSTDRDKTVGGGLFSIVLHPGRSLFGVANLGTLFSTMRRLTYILRTSFGFV